MSKSLTHLSLSLLLIWQTQSAVAQSEAPPGHTVRTQQGVSFTLPDWFLPDAVSPPAANAPGPITEFSFVDGDTPTVRVLVTRLSIDGASALRTLPTQSGPLPSEFARSFIAGMQSTGQSLAVTAGEYDADRHAFSARINSRYASSARMLSRQDDSGPAWRGLAASGADIGRTRCVLEALLKNGDNVQPSQLSTRFPYASQHCNISQEDLATYVRAQPKDFFMGGPLTQLTMNLIMPSSMTVITVSSPPASTRELEQLFSSIWVSAQVAGSAEQEPSRLSRLLAFSDVQLSYFVGVVVGALAGAPALMALIAWLLTKLRAPVALAVAAPATLLLGLVVLELTVSDSPSAHVTAKALAYLLGMGLLVRPLMRWLQPSQYA